VLVLFFKVELMPEEEELIIKQIADKIHNWGIDTAAILFLESMKPLALIGGQIGQSFISPFLLLISENIAHSSEKLFMTFEKHENVEKLIMLLEKEEKDSKNSRERKREFK